MSTYLNAKGFNGSIVKRFQRWGIHPNSMEKGRLGNMSLDSKLGPGCYNVVYPKCSLKTQGTEDLRSDWHRALFLEQQGKIPHFMSKYLYKEKEEQNRRMGPGKYEYKSFIDDVNKNNAASSMLSNDARFKEPNKDSFPAPGTYGKFGIPDQNLYEANMRRKQCNTVGILDRGGKSGREFYRKIYSIGPGIYQIKSDVDETLKKVVGKRNRYDCDSEPRLGPIKYGHHAILMNHNMGPGSYQFKEFITELNDRFHSFKGKFLKQKQYPKRPHERVYYQEPGNVPVDPENQVSPLTYEPRNPNYRKCEDFFGKKYPFNLSTKRMDKVALINFTGNRNPDTAPGRYFMEKYGGLNDAGGAVSSFKARPVNMDTDDRIKMMKEKIRPVNILSKPEEKLDHKATEKSVRIVNKTVTANLRLH